MTTHETGRTRTWLRRKPLSDVLAQAGDEIEGGGERHLKRRLGALDLIGFGVGVVIGTGIFTLTGTEAKSHAGPAVIISFVIAAVVAILAATCYAEMSASVPTAGSAYTYAYATMGEVFAWIIGWDLILEFALGAAVVARSWSGYVQRLFGMPTWMFGETAHVNLGAVLVVLVLGVVVLLGVQESARFTDVLVGVKIVICLFFIAAGLFFVDKANWHPFVPASKPAAVKGGLEQPLTQWAFGLEPHAFGIAGVLTASAILFFTFVGFEVIANLGEETKNPSRDMPIGLIGTLVVAAVLYVGVSAVLTGMVPYDKIDGAAPLAAAFDYHGLGWASKLVSVAAMCGLTSAILVDLVVMSRIGYALARDRLLPRSIADVHPRFGTPYKITGITIAAVMVVAALVPITVIADMISIGTLFGFIIVAVAVPILRRTRPDLERPFRVPFSPVLPIVSALFSLYLMMNLDLGSWVRFLAWLAIGMVIYVLYGRKHSRLAQSPSGQAPAEPSAP